MRPDNSVCSVGKETYRGKIQPLVARAAGGKETERSEPADKVHLGWMSESPGRNESERIGAPDT